MTLAGCDGGPLGSGGGDVRWTQVAAGGSHTCATAGNGEAYCWGRNTQGQLGRSDRNAFRPAPVEVSGEWTRVVSGRLSTCGLGRTGATQCWGTMGWAAFGTPAGPAYPTLAVGGSHLCGIAAAGGAYCWGDNFSGQLGIGLIDGTGYAGSSAPTRVAGGERFHSIAAGDRVSCALSGEGQPFCWGLRHTNDMGAAPRAVAEITARFDTLVLGDGGRGTDHECGLTAGREIYCWGWNSDGRAGPARRDGAPATPIVLPGGATPVALTAGGDDTDGLMGHSCALSAAGEAFCWGNNTFGQLGDGTTETRPNPMPVSGGHRFTQLSAGAAHTCGVTGAGELYCWGRNSSGQLGDGDRGAGKLSAIPVRVSPGG